MKQYFKINYVGEETCNLVIWHYLFPQMRKIFIVSEKREKKVNEIYMGWVIDILYFPVRLMEKNEIKCKGLLLHCVLEFYLKEEK